MLRVLEYSDGLSQFVLLFHSHILVLQNIYWTTWCTVELFGKHLVSQYWQSTLTQHCLNKVLGFSYTFCEIFSMIRQEWKCAQWSFGFLLSYAIEGWQISNAIKNKTVLKGIEYNSSTKGKCANDKEIESINCESEKWDTEVEKDKKVSFDNVTNVGWI